jgi:DNA-binding transcriptional ArsR family regulator
VLFTEICEPQVIEDPAKARLLVDETRQAIIHSLAERAMSFSQLARKLGKTPATIHFHIRKLEKAGFVKLQKTEIVNNNLTEKFYTLSVSPCIVGFGVNIERKGPVPPKEYRQMRTGLQQLLERTLTQNGGRIDRRGMKLMRDTEEMVSEVISENEVAFREMLAQLNLNLPLQDKLRIQRLAEASTLLSFCQLLCKPERMALLHHIIQLGRR